MFVILCVYACNVLLIEKRSVFWTFQFPALEDDKLLKVYRMLLCEYEYERYALRCAKESLQDKQ